MFFTPGIAAASCAIYAFKDFQVTPSRPYTISLELDRTGIANFTIEIYTAPTSGGTATLTTIISNPANGTVNYTFSPGQACRC